MSNQNSSDWEKLAELYEQATGLSAEEQKAFVKEKCPDPLLRKELLTLLKVDESSEKYFEDMASDLISSAYDELSDLPPETGQAGSYRIVKKIGRGGMGSVYLAERSDDVYKREVAVKILRKGMDSEDILARFNRERQILAQFSHPNITHLIDGGLTDDGRPYFVMEYVEGTPITEYCDVNRLSIRDRLGLFTQVCEALQYAHQNLVIHRDLKPGNILVTTDGQVKLLDFGIAKLVDESDDPILTRTGFRLLTPEYASPEQIRGKQVNTSTDIYQLGMVLYKLLCGKLPFTFNGSSMLETERIILEEEPLRPSAKIGEIEPEELDEICKSRSTNQNLLKNEISGDLDTIILKALNKETALRYSSAEQLNRDILNYLNDLPIIARPESRAYRMKKFVRRNKLGVVLGALSTILFFAGIGGVLWQANQTRIEAERALFESERATAVKDFLTSMITAANPYVAEGEYPSVFDILEQGSAMVETELAERPGLAAEMHGVIGNTFFGLGEIDRARDHFERSLQLIDEGAEIDPVTHSEIRYEYAFTLNLASRFDDAIDIVQETLQDLRSLNRDTNLLQSQLLLVLHDSRSILADYEGAHESALQAVDLACEGDLEQSSGCIMALLYLNAAKGHLGMQEEALYVVERAWNISENLYGGTSHPTLINASRVYGNALYENLEYQRSIEMLQRMTELSYDLYGERSFDYARAREDLARAYHAAGKPHISLRILEEVLEIGSEAAPRNSLITVWLVRIIQTAAELHLPERAMAAEQYFEEHIPDMIPPRTMNVLEMQRLRMQMNHPGFLPDMELNLSQQLNRARETGDVLIWSHLLLAGASAEIDAGNAEMAEVYLNEYKEIVSGLAAADTRPATEKLLKARLFALQGDLRRAEEQAEESLSFLMGIGHENDSPHIAQANAVLGGIRCETGSLDDGRSLLNESLEYWRSIAGSAAGEQKMNHLAATCL
ncbi:MAG: serine/threonine protein kinase [Balneolaceae bacterium]|nr:serine/threonine protein kinase [Balneolaceae bacterium]